MFEASALALLILWWLGSRLLFRRWILSRAEEGAIARDAAEFESVFATLPFVGAVAMGLHLVFGARR